MKYIFYLIVIAFLASCSKEIEEIIPLKKTPLSTHPYWSEVVLNDATYDGVYRDNFGDTLKIPIEIDLSLFIDDISELETNKSDFFSKLKIRYWSRFDKNSTPEEDSINFKINSLVKFDFNNTENLYFTFPEWDGFYPDDFENTEKGKYRYVQEIENKFFHKWDLRKYPFDKQRIRFTFTSEYDTSYVRLNISKKFNSNANENLANLKDGFVIDTILFKEEFIKSDIVEPFDSGVYNYDGGIERNEVRSRGVFEVILSRDGSWVFIKLFLGSFLSLLLSWFVFLIPEDEFDAKATISVGAIFGAVGNKYYVDSAVASQVLTTADLVNNIIITLVIFNVLIMIYKKNKKLKSKFLGNENSALKLSVFLFLISMTLASIFLI